MKVRCLLIVLLCTGCRLLPAPIPMTAIHYPMPDREAARCLVVLLPGGGDRGDSFQDEGFIDAIRKSGVSVDLVSADATAGYYFRGIASERLDADVIGPARTSGYEQVWLIGISMGGFGVLDYGQRHAVGVDGIFALAPYLGADSLGEEIRHAGGLARWVPDMSEPLNEGNYQRQLWSWLHRVVTGKEKGPSIYLGVGDDDGLGPLDQVLGQALPRDHVFHTPGGHEWVPWRNLLQQFLQASDFKNRCAD